ncbi:hypothetical protein BX600DRAFT_460862 [Xylariales sp. PMI_506]|nr:hypothetical protein BX600DRAFT_460862 [Xylariales sp. PMI_506]
MQPAVRVRARMGICDIESLNRKDPDNSGHILDGLIFTGALAILPHMANREKISCTSATEAHSYSRQKEPTFPISSNLLDLSLTNNAESMGANLNPTKSEKTFTICRWTMASAGNMLHDRFRIGRGRGRIWDRLKDSALSSSSSITLASSRVLLFSQSLLKSAAFSFPNSDTWHQSAPAIGQKYLYLCQIPDVLSSKPTS